MNSSRVLPEKLHFIRHNNTFFGYNNSIIGFKCPIHSLTVKDFIKDHKFQLWYTKVNPVNFKLRKLEKLIEERDMQLVTMYDNEIQSNIFKNNINLRLVDYIDFKDDIEEYILYSKLEIYDDKNESINNP